MRTYELAFAGTGNNRWDLVEEFQAIDDAAANEWADVNTDRMNREYGTADWYVLYHGNNING